MNLIIWFSLVHNLIYLYAAACSLNRKEWYIDTYTLCNDNVTHTVSETCQECMYVFLLVILTCFIRIKNDNPTVFIL